MADTKTIRRIRDLAKEKQDEGYSDIGDAFAHVAVKIFFELDEDEALEACDVGGPGDRGIDAYHHDDVERQVIVGQAKWAAKAKTFGREAASDLTSAWTTLTQLATQERPRAREQVIAASHEIQRLRKTDPDYPVGLYCFAAGSFSEQAKQTAEAFNRKHAEESVVMYLVAMDDLASALEQSESRVIDKPIGDVSLTLERSFTFSPADGAPTTLVGAIDCLQLAQIEREYRYRVFQRNVRFFLTARRRENKGMANTLSSEAGRSRFWFYNNGISIVCEAIRPDTTDEKTYWVTNMQIVNGCQTTTTLGENIAKLDDDVPAYVLVRIVAGADEELQSDISLYNNRQNAVTDRDLQSNDDIQERLQQEFDLLPERWFYERKRGEWDAKVKPKAAMKVRYGTRRLENEKVAQAAYAFHHDPSVARARKKYLFVRQADDPEKGLYEDIFNEHTTPEWLLLPYRFSQVVAERRTAFMKQLKDAQAAKPPGTKQLQVIRQDWIKFADQVFLGAMGYYLRERLDLKDVDTLNWLLDDERFDQVAASAYGIARQDLAHFFRGKHLEAEKQKDTFVPSNFVKGNWENELLPYVVDREQLREDVGEDVLGSLLEAETD